MNCKNAKILISASVDGELSQREQRRLQEHVCRCAECATEQAQVSNLRDVMAVWADEEPSDWLAQNFACRLEDEMARKPARRIRNRRRIFGTAVAGFATALLAFGFIMHSQFVPQQPVPPPAGNAQPANPVEQPSGDDRIVVNPTTDQPDKPVVVAVPRTTTPAHPVTVRPPKRTVTGPRITQPDRTPTADTTRANPGPAPLSSRIAAAGLTRNTRPTLSGRGSTGKDAEVKRMVLHNIMLASNTEGNTQSAVTDRIAHADLAMNKSVEEVRGVLRKAVDVLARADN